MLQIPICPNVTCMECLCSHSIYMWYFFQCSYKTVQKTLNLGELATLLKVDQKHAKNASIYMPVNDQHLHCMVTAGNNSSTHKEVERDKYLKKTAENLLPTRKWSCGNQWWLQFYNCVWKQLCIIEMKQFLISPLAKTIRMNQMNNSADIFRDITIKKRISVFSIQIFRYMCTKIQSRCLSMSQKIYWSWIITLHIEQTLREFSILKMEICLSAKVTLVYGNQCKPYF